MRLSLLASAAISCLTLAGCETMPAQGPTDSATDVSSTTQMQIDDSFEAAARASEASGDYLAAAGYWQSLLDREPTNLNAALGLAENLRLLGQYDHAVDVLRSTLAHHPDDPHVLALYGRALVQSGDAAAAIEPLQTAAEKDPNGWQTFAALGVAYGMVGQPERSNEANLRALAISPGNPKILNNMGLEAAMSGNLDAAIDLLERAAAHDDADITVRQNLALLLAYRGDIERAEDLARADLPEDMAERNITFYRSIAGNDLENIEDLVNQSTFRVEEESLDALATKGEAVDVVATEPVEPLVVEVVAVAPEEEIVEPAAEIVASAGVDLEPGTQQDIGTVEGDAVELAPQQAPESASPDDGALAPERIELQVDDVDLGTVEPAVSTAQQADEPTDDPILDLIGSITAPAPEAGAVAVIEDDGGAARQHRVNERSEDLPNDNSFDQQYLRSEGLPNDNSFDLLFFESALEGSEPIAVQGNADSD